MKNLINKFLTFFKLKKASNLSENFDSDYDDKFRIKVIVLKSGLSKFFPEYRLGRINTWEQIVMINNKSVGTVFLSDNELIITDSAYCDNEDDAKAYIELFKQHLIKIRENEFKNEQIIKV